MTDLILDALLKLGVHYATLWTVLFRAGQAKAQVRSETLAEQLMLPLHDVKRLLGELHWLGLVRLDRGVIILSDALSPQQTKLFGQIAYGERPRLFEGPDLGHAHFAPLLPDIRAAGYAPGRVLLLPNAFSLDEIQVVHDYANTRFGYTRKLTDIRRAKIARRLAEGFTPDDLNRVVDWVADNAFLRGANPRGRSYDDYTSIFRSKARVLEYLEQADKALRSQATINRELSPSERPPEFLTL